MKRLLPLAILVVVLPVVAMGKEDLSKYTGTYKGEIRSIRYLTMTLSLGDDGTATLTQSPDAVNEITSFGRWVRQGDIIRLNFESVGKQPAPSPMTFRLEHKTLSPITWNHNLWRTAPPPAMKRMKIIKHDPDDDL
jgi:hypothetical protein